MVTHSVTMLEKHLVFAGETPPRNFTTNRVKKRSIKPEDPMSHRIIEKRRRDRMNNCLADLSRLIPPEYLKKGRGRIEKTEIIEMAIKHMRHLQNVIASSRFNENSDNSVPSPPATATAATTTAATTVSRETATFTGDQPIVIEHYRLGYLECLSEAMHFLVEVQGYFAGDSLCVQMINHLHKHCDKILKGNTLDFPKKHVREGSSSESSISPANGVFNTSPPLGMSNSTGSISDDNQPNLNLEPVKHFELCSRNLQMGGHRSPRYSDGSSYSKHPEMSCSRYGGEREGGETENRSDSNLQNFVFKFKNIDNRKDSLKSYFNNFETAGNFPPRNYSSSNGVFIGESANFENVSLKEENLNGPSQLREMLTSPSSTQTACHIGKVENKGSTSPVSIASCCDSLPCHPQKSSPTPKSFKESEEGNPELSSDNHHMMYKFKNNIKQRFSKEKRENPEGDLYGDVSTKKQKPNEEYLKHSDPLMRERLNLLDRMDAEEEKVFKFNADFENKKRIRYVSESEIQNGDISNRLSFGHKSTEKGKRWEEAEAAFPYQNTPKLWGLTSNGSVPFLNSQAPFGCKPSGRQLSDYTASLNNSFSSNSKPSLDAGPGIPIFALHAKGSFYIPLTLDHATLSPFLTLLGITKTDEAVEEKTVLHPVTISVNFQSHLVR